VESGELRLISGNSQSPAHEVKSRHTVMKEYYQERSKIVVVADGVENNTDRDIIKTKRLEVLVGGMAIRLSKVTS